VQDLLEILENSAAPDDFLENTKLELYQDQVSASRPRASSSSPGGATSVDFAYAVHSQIGDTVSAPASTEGSCRCATSCKTATRWKYWTARAARLRRLGALCHYRQARARIRRFLTQQMRDQHRDQGKSELAKAFRQEGVDGRKSSGAVAKGAEAGSLDDLYVAVARNRKAEEVVNAAIRLARSPRPTHAARLYGNALTAARRGTMRKT